MTINIFVHLAAVRPWEGSLVIDPAMQVLDELRLRRHFRHRSPDWMVSDDWRWTLTARKLANEVENRVLSTCVGIPLSVEQPEQFLPGAYVDLALGQQNAGRAEVPR